LEDPAYQQAEVELHQGDRLILYTDGVTEAWNKQGEEYGEVRLLELIQSQANFSVDAMTGSIMSALSLFSQEVWHDDATLLAMDVL
jgi:sigma-B regulation protein RsbU (phosphoserine phosphatase)